ncbi:MAG: type II toxin-antitoxin system VapC family toxin [Candidatus Saliniplasma sp.]
MEWLSDLEGETVCLDTAPLIYYIEDGLHHEKLDPLFEKISKGEIYGLSSTITLLEVLVHPYREGNKELANAYRNILLNSENFLILPVVEEIAEQAAELRAEYGIKTPDAIQVATSIFGKAKVFLTNDGKLEKIEEIEILVLKEM